MKTYESETTLLGAREGVLIPISDLVSRKARFGMDRALLMDRAMFRRLFDRPEARKSSERRQPKRIPSNGAIARLRVQ